MSICSDKKILLDTDSIHKFSNYIVQEHLRTLYSSFPDEAFQDKQCILNEVQCYISQKKPVVFLDLSYMSAAEVDI